MTVHDLVCKIDRKPIAGWWFPFVFVTTHIRVHLCQVWWLLLEVHNFANFLHDSIALLKVGVFVRKGRQTALIYVGVVIYVWIQILFCHQIQIVMKTTMRPKNWKNSTMKNLITVEKSCRFCLNGTLHFGTLHFAILEGHVWASIDGERVLWYHWF